MKFCRHYILVAFITLLFSCAKDKILPTTSTFSYFPTEQGRYIIYNVDSVFHAENDNNTDDSVYTWHFQIKEVVDYTFTDGQGRNAQVIRRYRRDNDSSAWVELNLWTQVLTSSSAYRTEENVPYHKLSFPISSDITWNGNDANTLQEEIYSYQNFNSPLTINGFSFDSTLSVLQRDANNFVQKIYATEVYAIHVGMIYKERDDLGKLNNQVVKGTEYRMTLKSYGHE
jgi:hypothetical protein